MSEKSICGSMPWLNRFMPRVTRRRCRCARRGRTGSPRPGRRRPSCASSVGGDRRAAVVVRVQRDRGVLAPGQLAGEPLDLVGVDVRRRHLDRRRQVEDDLAAVVGLPDVGDRLADLDGERQLGAGEDLRGVLVAESTVLPRCCSAYFITSSVPRTAMSLASRPCRRGRRPGGTAAPARCRGGCWRGGTPTSDWTVRSIRSSRAWVSTEIVTSSGIRSRSISWRTKSKSVWLADGKPTSISL